ncbi:MAG: hypothetical protein OQK48_02695 [Sulfurimonas sp.]|uniref:hypothetical protein n=1 Tax=Sulfurimonas sp. TaxID=2022749 RepID=UPI002613EBC6|nr:hypothetical protein [Sulfurimonas sp.]MCW8895448.1 hypothetical protein [Sulfurimonas sp.]MCW8953832.1 hypothetical protein [Sulfurimonas sp.]MCW9067397.1 hypothetical protein [Sulfurimonas sp.]
MTPYFKELQPEILIYADKLCKNNVAIDKTNLMFLELLVKILKHLGTEDADKLDQQCEYNLLTMRQEFESVIRSDKVGEKTQAILLTFFLRIAKEMEVKYETIENEHLRELYTLMTSKGYKYPSYISSQKDFALDKMPENIKRMEHLK